MPQFSVSHHKAGNYTDVLLMILILWYTAASTELINYMKSRFRGLHTFPLWDITKTVSLAAQLEVGGNHSWQSPVLPTPNGLPAAASCRETRPHSFHSVNHWEEGCVRNIWTDPGVAWLCGTAKPLGLIYWEGCDGGVMREAGVSVQQAWMRPVK